jgi:hypothetical protein
VNTGGGKVELSLVNATNWTPGQQLRIRITLTDATARRWGFELTARKAGAPTTPAGTFATPDSNARAINTPPSGLPYITHTTVGTRSGTAGPVTWEVLWTPPASADLGNVTFYVAGNAANNNGNSDSGDKIYTANLTVSPADAGGATTTKVLPQFVFGGGWSTSIYLSNTTTSAASVKASFFSESGTALTVPNVGSTSTVSLAARGTAIILADNTGPLTQGWASLDLPDGVIGYAVFRQILSGVPDQEAVVPFSSANATTTTLVFDETDFVTGVGILNPSSSDTTVTMTARGPDGTVLGTSTLPLAAKNKTAIALQARAELAAIIGKRGSVDFTVSTGAVSVLGLRFKNPAFTSIPPVDR